MYVLVRVDGGTHGALTDNRRGCGELHEPKVKNIIPEGFAKKLRTDSLQSAEDALGVQ